MRRKKRVQWLDLVQQQNFELVQNEVQQQNSELLQNEVQQQNSELVRNIDYYIGLDDQKFCDYVHKQLANFLQSEIDLVIQLLSNEPGFAEFHPAVNFEDQTTKSPFSKDALSDYLKKLILKEKKLSSLSINERTINSFLEMVIELFAMINESNPIFQKNGALEYKKTIQRLDRLDKPLDRRRPNIHTIFDLTKLHFNIANELDSLEKRYLTCKKEEKKNGNHELAQKWESRITETKILRDILSVYPAAGEKKLIEDFLLGVRYVLKNFEGSSRAVLVNSLRSDYSLFCDKSEEEKKKNCHRILDHMISDDGRIEVMLGKTQPVVASLPRIFQSASPARPVDSRSAQSLPKDTVLPQLGRK